MVKILQPHRVTYATVSSPSVVTTLLSSVNIATCCLESFWKIACPETLHRSGYFDSHTYIIYLVGSVLLTPSHRAPIRSYFVEAEDKVTTFQSGYSVCAVNFRETLLYHLFPQNVGNGNM